MGRRVLVTGLATFWGGRLAQALEDDPSVDVIVGLDAKEPTVRLERTEFVRTDESYSILARIVRATKVDTVLHTFLVVDPGAAAARRMHEINVIGTMNLCAAVSAPGSVVRTLVLKSFTGVYGSTKEDPTLFAEDTPRPAPPRHRSELSLTEVEQYVCDLGTDHPEIAVSVLRFANVLGPDITTTLTRLLELSAVPSIFGFDPRLQFVHEDDVVRALRFAMDHRLEGAFNVAGDGLLPWSELLAMLGKRPLYLPPVATDLVAGAGRWLGIPPMPPEAVALLKYGRGVDTTKFKRAGFTYLFDTPGAVADHVGALRLRRTVGESSPDYRYDEDVEAFFHRSNAVLTARADEPR